MHARAVLVFLFSFLVALRAASAYSWASVGMPLTLAGAFGALCLAAVLTVAWYARQITHQPSTARSGHHGHLAIARW